MVNSLYGWDTMQGLNTYSISLVIGGAGLEMSKRGEKEVVSYVLANASPSGWVSANPLQKHHDGKQVSSSNLLGADQKKYGVSPERHLHHYWSHLHSKRGLLACLIDWLVGWQRMRAHHFYLLAEQCFTFISIP